MRFPGFPSILVVSLVLPLCHGEAAQSDETPGGQKLLLVPRSSALNKVDYLIEVGGELIFEQEKETTRRKLSVAAELNYDELRLEGPEESGGITRAVRAYETAKSVVKIDDGGTTVDLRPSRRLIGVELEGSHTRVFSLDGALTRPELDLVDNVANSLRIVEILPTEPVGVGDKWTLSDQFAAAFLDLDAVEKSHIECELMEITPEVVRFQFIGHVEGAKLGVETRLEVKGKARFDRRLNTVDWLGLLIKEQRPMGHVTHGLDVVARVQVRIVPAEASEVLDEETLAQKTLGGTPELMQVLFEPVHASWTLEHDRRWHLNLNHHDLAVFRLLDKGKFIAQCNVSPLEKVEPGKQATLESFQREIEAMLDETSRGFADAGQWASDKNYRILRTTVLGEAEGEPITWRYYLVSDQHGRQATFAFTVATDLVEQLADLDRQFVEALTFTEPSVAATENKAEGEERK